MQITVDISLYPLKSEFGTPILDFINRLRSFDRVTVRSNYVSTQVVGEYSIVMKAITDCLEETLSQDFKAAVVLKILNDAVELEWLE